MPRRGNQRLMQGFRGNWDMAERLSSIEQEGNLALHRDAADLFRRLNSASDVGGMEHCNQPRPRQYSRSDVVRADKPFAVAADIRHAHVPFLLMKSQRPQ